jgi:hypothetical protein
LGSRGEKKPRKKSHLTTATYIYIYMVYYVYNYIYGAVRRRQVTGTAHSPRPLAMWGLGTGDHPGARTSESERR